MVSERTIRLSLLNRDLGVQVMKNKTQISYWRDVDILLCFFNALVCGILSFNKILHILGATAFILMIAPIIGKKMYYADNHIPKAISVIIIFIRFILCVLLFAGLTINFLYLKNMDSPF